ncbi:hypothetical protein L0222_28230 [bacterium]|nr:hypothetical protein [bacterium]MCI0606901.1 hypothetical protein [bacterium]
MADRVQKIVRSRAEERIVTVLPAKGKPVLLENYKSFPIVTSMKEQFGWTDEE